jgi:hypothetical protein
LWLDPPGLAAERAVMSTNALTRAGLGFLAAASSVLVFHQGVWIMLWAFGVVPAPPFPVRPVPPFGVPQIISLCFWGGVYGLLYGLLAPRLARAPTLLLGLGLGLCAALVSWFLVAPLKGLPMAAGWVPQRMAISVLINGAWGIGTVLFLNLLLARRARPG